MSRYRPISQTCSINCSPCQTHIQSSKISEMTIFMLLLCLIVTIDKGEGSYCMASTGYKHKPSLYISVCCNSSNLGQAFSIKENGITQYIFCPNVYPKSCPKGTANIIEVFNAYIIDIRDCKSLFENGNTTSGVHTVNPDGGTPFKLSYKKYYIQSLVQEVLPAIVEVFNSYTVIL